MKSPNANYQNEHMTARQREISDGLTEGCVRVGNFRGALAAFKAAMENCGVSFDFQFVFPTVRKLLESEADNLRTRGIEAVIHAENDIELRRLDVQES
jgi:hypothetical protein